MVHSMVMVHNITTSLAQYIRWVTCQLPHHRSTTSTSSIAGQLHLWHKKKFKKNQYQLWALASKPITTSQYQ